MSHHALMAIIGASARRKVRYLPTDSKRIASWSGSYGLRALVFLSTMKELPQTLLLRPTEFNTMAVDVWSFASEALFTQAAFSAFILLAISAIPTYILSTRNLTV